MRKKKRYILLKSISANLPEGSKFLFQTEKGYVIKVSPKDAEKFRKECLFISGSIRKLKLAKGLKAGSKK